MNADPRESDLERYAEMFKALASPRRLRIFLRLSSCCPAGPFAVTEEEYGACVGELGADLDLAPSTVSHHIKELRRAGLITCERQGQNVQCCVAADAWDELRRFFGCPGAPAGS